MKFLRKNDNSNILEENLNYNTQSQRKRLKELLLSEQFGFCAYSERFALNTDSIHIEHFDPRLKNKNIDNYNNWYAVLAWMNEHKPKNIEPYLPILQPSSPNLNERIIYKNGEYKAIDKGDIEAKNLIKFLGLNKYELYKDRLNHIARIKSIKESYENEEDFYHILANDKSNLSFITAIESELDLNLSHLLN
jgi:hypothetical protein